MSWGGGGIMVYVLVKVLSLYMLTTLHVLNYFSGLQPSVIHVFFKDSFFFNLLRFEVCINEL